MVKTLLTTFSPEIIETKNSGSSLTSSATDLGSRKPSGRGTSGRGSASARSTAMGSARGARSTRRKPMSGYVRIEDEINLHHLIKLMRIFHVSRGSLEAEVHVAWVPRY